MLAGSGKFLNWGGPGAHHLDPPPPMYHTEMFPIPQCFFGTIAVLPQFCLERLKFMFMCKRGIFESRPSLGSLPEGAWGSTKPRTAIRRRSVRADCLCHA